MDVLQVLKEGHDRVRALSSKAESTKKLVEQKASVAEWELSIREQLHLETSYLYPEIEGLFAESDVFVKEAKLRQKAVENALAAVGRVLKTGTADASLKKIEVLSTALSSHLDATDKNLFPKIRQLISTPDREDLGQLFIDLRTEFRNLSQKPLSKNKPLELAKKRA